MKKRVISIIMVAVLLMTLVPFGAFAELGGTVIETQPKDVSADIGDTVSFTIEASNPNSSNLKYLWFDSSKVNTNSIDGGTFIKDLEKAKLGTEKTLTIYRVTEAEDGLTVRCAVYYTERLFPKDLSISEEATLTLRPSACDEHRMVMTAAVPATCAKEGNVEYYYCKLCQRYYLDIDGKEQVSLDECITPKLTTHGNVILVAAKDPTCCEKGCIKHYGCEICGQPFIDADGTVMLEFADVEIPKNANAHTNLVHYDAVPATCCEQGNIEYWYCDGCDVYYEDAECTQTISKVKIDVDKDKTNHTALEFVAPNKATCTADGNLAHYYCSGCKDYFSDAEGTKETTKAAMTVPKIDHVYSWQNDVEANAHYQQCSGCGKIKNSGAHSGGEAFCTARAVCDTCGFEYGEVDPNNHKNTEKQITVMPTLKKDGLCDIYCHDCEKIVAEDVAVSYDEVCDHDLVKVEEIPAKCESCKDATGAKEHYECSICGALFFDADGKSPVEDVSELALEPLKHYYETAGTPMANPNVQVWAANDESHWKVCKFCDYIFSGTGSTHTVIGNADPTCCKGGTCAICGHDDGKRDPENHSGGTELINVREPADGKAGYTGDTKCLGCGEILEYGRAYYDPCAGGCASTLRFVPPVEKTCTEDGVKAHYICMVCGNRYMDENAETLASENDIIDICTGHDLHPGKTALTSVDLASLMKSLDITTEDIQNMIQNGDFSSVTDINIDSLLDKLKVKDIDHCHDDTYHWLGCQRCGKTLVDIRPELEAKGIKINERWYELSAKTAHSGGAADCANKPICDECGEVYGQLGSHRYNAVVTEPTCTEGGYTTHTCSGCKDSYVDSYTEAVGHKIVKGRCEYCKQTFKNPFVDVDSTSIYYEHVMWAYYYTPQITGGTDATHFSPMAPCTRGQVVTFLWRAAGRPEPTNAGNPFDDVSNSGPCQPYYTAILWAVENNITNGYYDGTFRPHAQVTRAEFVTFLWRYYGSPSPSNMSNPFIDVSNSGPFYKAILWASEQGITQGYGNNEFKPNKICSRWQVVTFLHRAID